MVEEVNTDRLPSSELGNGRFVRVSTPGHGDVRLETWVENNNEKCEKLLFGMPHSSEARIVYALFGFMVRLGVSSQDKNEIVSRVAETITDDEPVSLTHDAPGNIWRRHEMTTNGTALRSWDVAEQNLECLTVPVPSSPGTIERQGFGYAFYTKEEKGGELSLVLGRYNDSEKRVDQSVKFGLADVEPLMVMVCDISQGQYRSEIKELLEHFLENKKP